MNRKNFPRTDWQDRHDQAVDLCRKGDLKGLVLHGFDDLDVSYNQGAMLRCAVESGNEDMVKTLVSKGAKVKQGKFAALYAAISGKEMYIFRFLYDHVKELSSAEMVNMIVTASFVNAPDILEFLFDRKTDVIEGDINLPHLLSKAASSGQIQLLERLFNEGIDVNEGQGAALMGAINGHKPNVVKYLFNKKANPDIREGAATVQAFRLANENICDLFLKNKADINVHDGAPLLISSKQRNKTQLKKLIHAGIDATANEHEAYMQVVKANMDDVLEILLEGNVDIYFNEGQAMKTAIKSGFTKTMTTLFEAGFDPTNYTEFDPNKLDPFTVSVSAYECLHYYYTKYDYRKQLAKARAESDSDIVFAARSNSFQSYLKGKNTPIGFDELIDVDQYKNTVVEILAARGRLSEIMEPSLWEGQEIEALKFFDRALKHKIVPKNRQEFQSLRQNLALSSSKNTARRRPRMSRRSKKA